MIPYRGKATIERTIKYIEENLNYTYLGVLKSYDFNELKFRLDEEELSKIILKFVQNNINPLYFSLVSKVCESLKLNVAIKENKKILDEIINLFVKNSNLFPVGENFDKLFSSFNNKELVIEFLNYIYSNKKVEKIEVLNVFIDYLIKARQYYVDDRALLSSLINFIGTVEESSLLFGHIDDIKTMVSGKLRDDKKANGIYDIDQSTLRELDAKIGEFESISSKLEALVQITDQQIKTMTEESKGINDEITNIKIRTLKSLKDEANMILSNFNTNYLTLLNKEKENISNQRDILLADVDTYINQKKFELESLASSVAQRIAIELGRIRNLSDHSIEKIQDFISNNDEVKKMFQVAKEDKAFLSRLAKMDNIPTPQLSLEGSSMVQPGIIQASYGVPSIIIQKPEREVVEKVNYYFDKTIPFKDRFNELMQKKAEDIEKTGAIYHTKFDDLLTIVLNNDTPYMYGLSGCGKTYMIEKQLAKLLGIDVVTNGFIMYETDILGFNNATGAYVPSNFYRCYKFGDMIFLDELDNSNPVSTIVLNSFIGKNEDSSYTFPNGDRIKRHPNFRILSAGNTRGTGKTESHNTRQKLDEAVMQRLTPIEIDYDNRIEQRILVDYPGWYNFAINFRQALKEIRIDGADGPNYNGTITTRDIEAIRRYKDDDSFSDEKILEYEVIETKDADYLNQIISEMDNLVNGGAFNDDGYVLLDKFKKLCKGRKY